jgi:hypothetical protein
MTPKPDTSSPVSSTAIHARRPRAKWFQRIASILFVIFCLELGLFLLIYPWTESWSANYFSYLGQGAIGPLRLQPAWHELWNNSYVRGAVSGLGLVNIWVAVAEALRMYIGGDSRNDVGNNSREET